MNKMKNNLKVLVLIAFYFVSYRYTAVCNEPNTKEGIIPCGIAIHEINKNDIIEYNWVFDTEDISIKMNILEITAIP